jgi:hypothetical protein
MQLPKPDAIEMGGLGVGETPCIKLVYKLGGQPEPTPSRTIIVGADPLCVQSPRTRDTEVETLLGEVLKPE